MKTCETVTFSFAHGSGVCGKPVARNVNGRGYCDRHARIMEREAAALAKRQEEARAARIQSAKLALADAVLAASEFRNGSLAGVNNTAVWDAIAAYRAATGEGR